MRNLLHLRTLRIRRFSLGLLLVMFAASAAQAAPIVYVGNDDLGAGVVVGVFGRDYLYVNRSKAAGDPGPNWFSNTFDHSTWSTGEAAFGNTGGIGGAFFNPTRTGWPAGTDMFVFTTFTLGTPIPMTAKTAVDNGYDLFVNDAHVAGANAEGFTTHWEYTDALPAALFHAGTNWLGFHLEDHGGATAWDFALIGDSSGQQRFVPEPGTLLLVGAGLAGLAGTLRRRSEPS